MQKSKTAEPKSVVVQLLKCLICSLILTLIFVLLSALVVKIFNVSTQYIPLLNQINKTLSILISVLIYFRGVDKGFVRGATFGLIYIVTTFILFSLINGEFSFGISFLIDLILGGVSGLISGVIAVNLRK